MEQKRKGEWEGEESGDDIEERRVSGRRGERKRDKDRVEMAEREDG